MEIADIIHRFQTFWSDCQGVTVTGRPKKNRLHFCWRALSLLPSVIVCCRTGAAPPLLPPCSPATKQEGACAAEDDPKMRAGQILAPSGENHKPETEGENERGRVACSLETGQQVWPGLLPPPPSFALSFSVLLLRRKFGQEAAELRKGRAINPVLL